ncbi:Metallo-hydrolase/oxidoreductase [Aspergillus neoniger CBS 115656]|uniref:Metallo-hydrolase/oxidoreductase n=1 Tax=Aspergillus neoniger (strain CBS 115656) TaxID=1448310 RepID=A0A318YVX0_ASPNB|nr:Metallo-hydrolase/oxidoreductase [Aspergillus neoniger CBS 115656]PYH29352.1 Metallo-hydrolase/oxidoreductase [Aspergillus neoniger CBS 115656]
MGLDYKVFTSRHSGVSRTTPAGHDELKWVPTTSTLIFGQRDAVLVDTQLTMAAAKDLADWVVGTGKNLTTMYITHAHGDHFYGTSGQVGHTDTDDTTALWVPAIGLVVAGDAVYNNTHPYLGESKSQEARSHWVAALDKIAALQPRIVVGGHSDLSKEFSPDAVQTTKDYLNDFARLDGQTFTPEELYSQMMELYPTRLNVGSLWGGATLVKK